MDKTSNRPKPSTDLYRVVLECWDSGESVPYADDLSGVKLSLFDSEEAALTSVKECIEQELALLNGLEDEKPREQVAITDSGGKAIRYECPYTSDFVGEDCGYIRFWNGNSYQIVTTYRILPVVCDDDNLEKCSYYKYRGFWILPNNTHNSFRVEQFDTTLFKFRSLKSALRKIDDFLIAFQYNKITF